ncbi:MAG: hypothetical protein WEC15_06945 [Flavobacteriales bacterium]
MSGVQNLDVSTLDTGNYLFLSDATTGTRVVRFAKERATDPGPTCCGGRPSCIQASLTLADAGLPTVAATFPVGKGVFPTGTGTTPVSCASQRNAPVTKTIKGLFWTALR